MNMEHSDVRACIQGVYSCFVKRLLRDHINRQQSSDSLLYICGHNIPEDYDQETESIQRYPVSPTNRFSSPAKKWPGNGVCVETLSSTPSASLWPTAHTGKFL